MAHISIPDLVSSKKAQVAAATSGLAYALALEHFTPEMILVIISPLLAFVVAQGLSDLGKGRAEIGSSDQEATS